MNVSEWEEHPYTRHLRELLKSDRAELEQAREALCDLVSYAENLPIYEVATRPRARLANRVLASGAVAGDGGQQHE